MPYLIHFSIYFYLPNKHYYYTIYREISVSLVSTMISHKPLKHKTFKTFKFLKETSEYKHLVSFAEPPPIISCP